MKAIYSIDASGAQTSGLPGNFRVDCRRRDPRAGGSASGGKSGLLRENEDGPPGK